MYRMGVARALIHEAPGHSTCLHRGLFSCSMRALTPPNSPFSGSRIFSQIQHSILLLPGQSFFLAPPSIYTLSFQILIIFQHKVPLSFTLMVLEGRPQVTSTDFILFRDVTSSVFKHSLERKNLHATLPSPPPKITTGAPG